MQEKATRFQNGKIVRSEEPLNLEMPFEKLDGFITATEAFYVRTHFPIPKIDKNEWRLRVEGEVKKPFELGYDELLKLESRKTSRSHYLRVISRSGLRPVWACWPPAPWRFPSTCN